jgi:hypothetical protein
MNSVPPLSFSPGLLKKVHLQGGRLEAERGVLVGRRSECRGAPTPSMGLVQQPAKETR